VVSLVIRQEKMIAYELSEKSDPSRTTQRCARCIERCGRTWIKTLAHTGGSMTCCRANRRNRNRYHGGRTFVQRLVGYPDISTLPDFQVDRVWPYRGLVVAVGYVSWLGVSHHYDIYGGFVYLVVFTGIDYSEGIMTSKFISSLTPILLGRKRAITRRHASSPPHPVPPLPARDSRNPRYSRSRFSLANRSKNSASHSSYHLARSG